MIILFVGPSLAGYHPDFGDLCVRPPAKQGDLFAAAQDGASAIGLVDGYFEQSASVWHKEILFALAGGIPVAGAASMGALRAAECAHFGMHAIGAIAADYLSGKRTDDSDVAVHCLPAEAGHLLLTEPRVNIDATLERLLREGDIDEETFCRARSAIRKRHYSTLSVGTIFDGDDAWLNDVYDTKRVDQKALDALDLIGFLKAGNTLSKPSTAGWVFQTSPTWRRWLDHAA